MGYRAGEPEGYCVTSGEYVKELHVLLGKICDLCRDAGEGSINREAFYEGVSAAVADHPKLSREDIAEMILAASAMHADYVAERRKNAH